MKNRKYKSGTRWGFWLWTEVPSEFITRLHLIKTPYFAIVLHWLNAPDPEPYLHDHPITFLSLILRGGYKEIRYLTGRYHKRGYYEVYRNRTWFNWIRASNDDRHSIVDVKPKTLTLCFMGPKTRDWGYHTETGWIYWKDYNDAKYATSKITTPV